MLFLPYLPYGFKKGFLTYIFTEVGISMNKKKTRKFLGDAFLLTAVSLTMRTVAVTFNSYVTSKVGAAGMGLYTLVTSVYTFAVTFATSGINLGVTRTVAEALGKKEKGCVRQEMSRALKYALFFGLLAFSALFFGADIIGRYMLDDVRTVKSIRVFAISLPFIALSSCFNGYFCAVRKVWKNAAAQLFEQFIKIYASVLLLTALLPAGVEYACLALVCGGAMAETLSVIFAAVTYLFDRSRKAKTCGNNEGGGLKRLLSITLPVAFSAYVRSALVTVEHMLIPRGLRKFGLGRDAALARYGVIQGMVLPVVLYPAAFSTSFAGLLVPELAEKNAKEDLWGRDRLIEKAFRGILMFSVCAAGILAAEAYNIGELLYRGTDAGKYIRVLACLVPIMYTDTVADGILKGIGEQLYSMYVNIFDASLSVLLVAFILPKHGISGYVAIVIGCEVLNASLSIGRILTVTKVKIPIISMVLVPLAAIIISTAAVSRVSLLLTPLSEGAELTVRIILNVLIYAILICVQIWAKEALRKAAKIIKSKKLANTY